MFLAAMTDSSSLKIVLMELALMCTKTTQPSIHIPSKPDLLNRWIVHAEFKSADHLLKELSCSGVAGEKAFEGEEDIFDGNVLISGCFT